MSRLRLVVNEATRRLDRMFPGFFPAAKHNHYADFGYPETLQFEHLYGMYARNGLARAAVEKTIGKTWQDNPFLLEKERDGSQRGRSDETKLEREIRRRFDDLRVWQRLAEADRRAMVGGYSGAILRLGDNRRFFEPVDYVPGGIEGLIEIIPAWAGQLTVSEWDTDEMSDAYGRPKMFQFSEAAVDADRRQQPRQFNVHPDRVVIWSRDGTVHCQSALEPGYNDLITLEKVSGAGGEGFWKNAKSAPVLEIDKEIDVETMAKAMGVPPAELADRMNAQVEDYQKGFDKLLLLQGIQAKTLGITLPSPEHFFAIALQAFAASMSTPLKILVGSQTGERASTEDASEWAQTNMARRTNQAIPNMMEMVNRFERFRMIPERDWHIDWTDLTESSMAEKIDRAAKMADVNQKTGTAEWVFTPEEIRAAVDLEPLAPADALRDETTDDDEQDALVVDPLPQDAA